MFLPMPSLAWRLPLTPIPDAEPKEALTFLSHQNAQTPQQSRLTWR
jgi:hypothetical protein